MELDPTGNLSHAGQQRCSASWRYGSTSRHYGSSRYTETSTSRQLDPTGPNNCVQATKESEAALEKEREALATALERLAMVQRELAMGQHELMTGQKALAEQQSKLVQFLETPFAEGEGEGDEEGQSGPLGPNPAGLSSAAGSGAAGSSGAGSGSPTISAGWGAASTSAAKK